MKRRTRFRSDLQVDGTIFDGDGKPIGGGSTLSPQTGLISANSVLCSSGFDNRTGIPWDGDAGLSNLLNLTDPLAPVAIVGGLYAISVGVYLDGPGRAGKTAMFTVELDAEDTDGSAFGAFPLDPDYSTFTQALIWPVPVGGVFGLSVRHDGGANTSFAMVGSLVLLSEII